MVLSFRVSKVKNDDVGAGMITGEGKVLEAEYTPKKRYAIWNRQKYIYLLVAIVLMFATIHAKKRFVKIADENPMIKAERVADDKPMTEEERIAEEKRLKEHHEQVKNESLVLVEKLISSIQNDGTANLQATLDQLKATNKVAYPQDEQEINDEQFNAETMGAKEYHEKVKNQSLELLEKLKNSIQNDNTANLQATLDQLKVADWTAHPPP